MRSMKPRTARATSRHTAQAHRHTTRDATSPSAAPRVRTQLIIISCRTSAQSAPRMHALMRARANSTVACTRSVRALGKHAWTALETVRAK